MSGAARIIFAFVVAAACNAAPMTTFDANNLVGDGNNGNGDGNNTKHDGGMSGDGNNQHGGPLTCSGPGNPKSNGSGCGSERWSIKVGTDSQASSIALVAQPNTIAALAALPAAGGGSSRESPTETTIYELKNVVLTELKEESDSDYHLVVSDGSSHTMIVEIPYQGCDSGSTWSCFISSARSNVDAKYNVSTTPIYPAATITVRGVGFFDVPHGQTGVAPNAIELHPVLQVCFGTDCFLQ
jgi:hypothetical protein